MGFEDYSLDELERKYTNLLERYLDTPTKPHLNAAYEFGREALEARYTAIDIFALHQDSLMLILEDKNKDSLTQYIESAAAFLLEILTCFGNIDHQLKASIEILNKRIIKSAQKFYELRENIATVKRAEQIISQMNTEFELRLLAKSSQISLLQKELESLTYSISHDLRAPLRHISGYVEFLLEDKELEKKLSEENKENIDVIKKSVEKMDNLINELLEFSRLTRVEIKKTKQNLNVVAENLIQEFKNKIKDRKIEWHIDNSINVYADPEALHLLMKHLLSNAIKFTQPREKARIELKLVEMNDKETIFVIKDNGVGFDMKYSNKLFNLFQRLHGQNEFSGLGMGLASVYKIVDRHGGRIWVDSQVNNGANFFIALPSERKLKK